MNIQDKATAFKTKQINKVSKLTGYCVKDVRSDCAHLKALLIQQENIEKEFNLLKAKYTQKGLELLVSCMTTVKTVEDIEETPEEAEARAAKRKNINWDML